MKVAQWISTLIYVSYVALMAVSFEASQIAGNETAIIGVTAAGAPILPALLVVAALAAQFSAAVADTAGSGGLIQELSKARVRAQTGYLAIAAGGLVLTWTANIFQIIAYASRAFALYYGLQCGVAAVLAWRKRSIPSSLFFIGMACLAMAMAILGVPAE